MFGDALSNSLSLLINESFEGEIFPDRLKEAQIVSLHKSGKLTDLNNHRPIAFLNTISKIFEKSSVSILGILTNVQNEKTF